MKHLWVALLAVTTLAVGCAPASEPAPPAAAPEPVVEAPKPEAAPALPPPAERSPKAGEEVAVLETNLGKIVLMFFPDKAPKHVENFKKLAKTGFYDGVKFHRVIPDFMIQGGDPNSKDNVRANDGTGGSGTNIPAEFNDTPHVRGIVSMARSQDPNSASSQFFIVVTEAYPSLDGAYTAFGKVVQGMDVADKIKNLPRDENDNPLDKNPAVIKKVTIVAWPLKK